MKRNDNTVPRSPRSLARRTLEKMLSLLVVVLMLSASVVYSGHLFGYEIGVPQPVAKAVAAPPAAQAPFHGDMTLEKLRAEDVDTARTDTARQGEPAATAPAKEEHAQEQAPAPQPKGAKAETVSADATPPTAQQLARLGMAGGMLAVVDKGHWSVSAANGKQLGSVISSEPFAAGVKGFNGPTPVFVAIGTDGVVKGIVALDNDETPSFFTRLEEAGLFNKWNGKKAAEAAQLEVDAVSGATFSSRAVIENVKAALARYANTVKRSEMAPAIGWPKTLIMFAVLALGVYAAFRKKKSRALRYAVLVLNVVVTGFFCGQFLSLSLFRGWVQNGFDPIVVLPALVLLVLTLILSFFGRSNHHCTWACPYGSLQELAYALPLPKLKLKPQAYKWMRRLRLAVLLTLLGLAWSGVAIEGVLAYEPFSAFLVSVAAPAVIVLAASFVVLSIFVPSLWCHALCPTGELLSLAYDGTSQRVAQTGRPKATEDR